MTFSTAAGNVGRSARGNVGGEQFGSCYIAQPHEDRPMAVWNADFRPFVDPVDGNRPFRSFGYLSWTTGGVENFLNAQLTLGRRVYGLECSAHVWNLIPNSSRSKPLEFHTEIIYGRYLARHDCKICE
jgi:hypothetical protein